MISGRVTVKNSAGNIPARASFNSGKISFEARPCMRQGK